MLLESSLHWSFRPPRLEREKSPTPFAGIAGCEDEQRVLRDKAQCSSGTAFRASWGGVAAGHAQPGARRRDHAEKGGGCGRSLRPRGVVHRMRGPALPGTPPAVGGAGLRNACSGFPERRWAWSGRDLCGRGRSHIKARARAWLGGSVARSMASGPLAGLLLLLLPLLRLPQVGQSLRAQGRVHGSSLRAAPPRLGSSVSPQVVPGSTDGGCDPSDQ